MFDRRNFSLFILAFVSLSNSWKENGKLQQEFIDCCKSLQQFRSVFDLSFCKKKKDLYFITNVGVKKNPFTRIFCYAFNCLYVDGDDPFKNLGVLKESISLLKKGKIIAIFPEGVIRPCKNGFLEFNRGFAFLAKKAKSTIYPIYLYPVVFPFKRSQIYIGDPILFETIKEKSDLEISMMVQAIVMDLSLQAEKDGKTK